MSIKVHRMETVTINWSGQGMRRETFRGRSYIVAPMTMIKAGAVLNGSQGPLLYPTEEVSKNPGIWDHIPLTVNHPTDEQGNPVRARTPKTLEKHQIGYVFNDQFNGSSRDAEGWFDVESTRKLAPAILNRLESGQPIELSTGLHTRNEPVQNGRTQDGRSYSHVARDYVPDHLAILPNQVGACSLKDGCGVLRNELCESCQTENAWSDAARKAALEARKRHSKGSGNEYGHHSGDVVEIPSHLEGGGQRGRITDSSPSGSHFAVSDKKCKHIGYYHGSDLKNLTRRQSMKDAMTSLEKTKTTTTNTQGVIMTKDELVQHLTTNCSCFKGKEKVLNELDEDALAELKADQDELTENRLVVNSVKEFIGKDDLTLNAMPEALMAAKAPPPPMKKKPKPGCEDPGDEDETETPDPKKMAMNFDNFLTLPAEQRMTPDELKAIQFASGMEQQYKRQMVDRVVSNQTSDPKQQKAIRPLYEKLSLNELQTLVNNTVERPVQKQAETPLVDFFGLGLTQNRAQSGPQIDEDDVLSPFAKGK